MNLMTLPPVAKSFFTLCKKCGADRYHRVLAHTTTTSAKIECEICKSKRTYSLPKTSTTSKTKKPSTRTVSARRVSHADEYNTIMAKRGEEKGLAFSIRTKYELHQKIDHPKFGPGFVKAVLIDSMEVMFQDELKTLIHNKI
jgi:hypothetical protein